MPKMYMLCGLAASGKSTIAKKLLKEENAIIHSSDAIRKELYSDEKIQEDNQKVFQILHKRIKEDLKSGKNVCYDATNVSYKRRMAFLREIKNIDCEKICILVATPYEQCLEQNRKRDRQVPEYVIERMYKSFYIPQYYEGWNKIEIVWNFDRNKFDLDELFLELDNTNQDNPHHTLTIGKHCMKCSNNLAKYNDFELFFAGYLHDISKGFCKEFKNSKGETTDIAHYFQHHLVSAYMSLFYLKSIKLLLDDKQISLSENDILNICNLIQWHMIPYFIQNEKTENKYKNLLGIEIWNKLLKLHEADKMSK